MCLIRREPQCPFSPSTSSETWSFVVLQADRPESLWGRFSCLCLPPLWRSVGITGVHHCAWLWIGSWDSNWDPRACSVNASPSTLSPHPMRTSKQGPVLLSKQHSGPVLEATGSPCLVSLKLLSLHTFNICLLSLSLIPRDSGFSVPRCCLAHGVNTIKPYRVVMDRGSMRGSARRSSPGSGQ